MVKTIILPNQLNVKPKNKNVKPKKEKPIPGIITNRESEFFYSASVPFDNNRRAINFQATKYKCNKCGLYSKHTMFTGYCYIQKRIVDTNETCDQNTMNDE